MEPWRRLRRHFGPNTLRAKLRKPLPPSVKTVTSVRPDRKPAACSRVLIWSCQDLHFTRGRVRSPTMPSEAQSSSRTPNVVPVPGPEAQPLEISSFR